MQALNLLIASDNRIIFIIGLDRIKVAAGLAVKYEPILPYLNSQPSAIQIDNEISKKSIKGLEFGYEFIEKFIQVPFSVPLPDKINIQKLIEEMTPKEDDSKGIDSRLAEIKNTLARIEAEEKNTRSRISSEEINALANINPEVEKERAEIKSEVTRDSDRIREIALMVSTALDNNPRRMKQFINLFRLRVFIATNTGLLGEGKDLTLEQLGKFVAITLKWPMLIANLEYHPELLNELHKIAIGAENENSEDAKHWKSERKLIDLLKYNCDTESSEKYSLENLDVKTLLKVSPKTVIEE